MVLLGARALIDIAVPTGVDGAEVLRFQLQDGRTAQEAIAEAAAIIGAVNEEIMATYGGLLYLTETQFGTTTQGGARGRTPAKAEFKRADGIRTEQIGSMLPLRDYEDAVEWTPLYLRRAYRSQITGDLQAIADRWRQRMDFDIWKRAMLNTENLIGTAGYDVPWAIGTGTNVNFIPPDFGSKTFDSTHTHFVADTDFDDAANLAVSELRHHGHRGRLSIYVNPDDTDEVSAFLTDGQFIKYIPRDVNVVAGSTSAPVAVAEGELEGMPGEVFGLWDAGTQGYAELRSHWAVPAQYGFVTKSYGVNNPRNGLAIREEPGIGFGLRVMPQVTSDINPELDYVKFEATHGVGVNDRLNGVSFYFGNNTWTNPTFTE